MLENQEAYKHDFDGSCAPKAIRSWPGAIYSVSTFSVGIFQWVPKASRKGLKRTAVKYRIKGNTSNPETVYARARQVCRGMDEGWMPEKKSETVKG